MVLLLVLLLARSGAPSRLPISAHPGSLTQSKAAPVLWALTALVGLGVVVGLLAWLLGWLRKKGNPLYWEVACWFLVAIGILVRPLIFSGAYPIQTTVKGALVAGVIALAVFPALMRLLNRLKPRPDLGHVAVPFACGFLLDITQLAAKTYVPGLEFLK